MPRLQDTRQYKAQELKRLLELGPAFLSTIDGEDLLTPHDAALQYRRWLRPWIIYALIQLVPELKGAKINGD